MARAIDKQPMLDLIIEAKRTDPETGSFAEWLAEYLVERLPTLTPPNEPLTLEELREMNEEPVWIQNLEEPTKSQWRLLYWDREKYLVLQGISVRGYLLEEYGESWLAYRCPPEKKDKINWHY